MIKKFEIFNEANSIINYEIGDEVYNNRMKKTITIISDEDYKARVKKWNDDWSYSKSIKGKLDPNDNWCSLDAVLENPNTYSLVKKGNKENNQIHTIKIDDIVYLMNPVTSLKETNPSDFIIIKNGITYILKNK